MAQFDFGNMESPLSGTEFINDNLEPWRDAVHTTHSGSTRPAYVQEGMIWLDTTNSALWRIKIFNGSNDITIGTIDTSALKFGIVNGTIEGTPIGQTTPAALTATNIRYTGDIDFSSDRRLKRDIKPIKGMLALLKKLRPVEYRRKPDGSRVHLGFIAQEVQKVFPEMVGKDDNGHLTLHGMDMASVLVAAVQEMSVRLEKLENKR